jgi:DNA-binding protein HU-beta
MTRHQLAEELVRRTGVCKGKVDELLAAFVDVSYEALARGEYLHLRGLGTLYTLNCGARKGRNISTDSLIEIPARRMAKLRPAKRLRNLPVK